MGQVSLELAAKGDQKINPIDLQRAVHQGNRADDSWENQVLNALNRGKVFYQDDFFLVVLFKKERLLPNVVRQYFFHRASCPTPEYDQTVYKYHRKEDKLEFIWVVPSQEHCIMLPLNRHLLPLDQHILLEFIDRFNSGSLDQMAKQLNGEPNG